MALATLHHHLPLATTLPSTVNHLVELETPSSPSTSCLPPSLQGRTLNPTFLSRYRILYELGSGGFGFVCAIEPKPRGSSVGLACKFILKAKALSGLAMDPTLGWVTLEVYVLRNVCSAFFRSMKNGRESMLMLLILGHIRWPMTILFGGLLFRNASQ